MRSIVLPNSLTSLGDYAFYQCTNVSSITLSTNLTSIGNWVFTYCNPTSIVIPAGVTNIGDYALGGWYFVSAAVYFTGNAPTNLGAGVLQEARRGLLMASRSPGRKIGCTALAKPRVSGT